MKEHFRKYFILFKVIDIGLIFVFAILTMESDRFIAQILLILMATLLVFRFIYRNVKWLNVFYLTGMIVLILSFFSPLDLAIRSSQEISVKIVKVVRTQGRKQAVEMAKVNGQVNMDFIIYGRISEIPGPYKAILFTIPTTYKIDTPFFNPINN